MGRSREGADSGAELELEAGGAELEAGGVVQGDRSRAGRSSRSAWRRLSARGVGEESKPRTRMESVEEEPE